MVVLSHTHIPPQNPFFLVKTCVPTTMKQSFLPNEIPEIDLSDPQAKTLIVKACEDLGFFKLVNHGVPLDLINNLEHQALNFFRQPQTIKDTAGPPDPFGYGRNQIGLNGDVGFLEFLLLNTNPHVSSPKSLSIFHQNPHIFWSVMEEYVGAVKGMCCELLELMAEGLEIEPRNALSRLVSDEGSDCIFRVNHYPPSSSSSCDHIHDDQCQEEEEEEDKEKVIGFGEHTDPQMISALRSNNTSGLQICARDGTWISVPPDHSSFFINVGDILQVLTNGRFRSVRHRVLANRKKSRLSMIFFGASSLSEKIGPLGSLLTKQELKLYKDFTWCEYKNAAYKSRLSDNRLSLFENKSSSSSTPI